MKNSPNSSSIAMMISTWSKLSSPRSFVKCEDVFSYKAKFTPPLESRQPPILDCSDDLLSSTAQVDNSVFLLSFIANKNKQNRSWADLLRADLVVELEDVHDAVFDVL